MGDVSREGGVARRVPLPDGTYTRPHIPEDVVAKVIETPVRKRPRVNTEVETKEG